MANERSEQHRDKAAEARSQAARKQLADDKEAMKAQQEQRDKNKGTPTPTQEEADLLKLGEHPDLAEDGSAEDPNVGFGVTRHMEGSKGGGYATRQSTAQHSQHPQHQTHHQSSAKAEK